MFISSGLIEVNDPRKLDFETRPVIRLTVIAEGGGVYGYTTVWVQLKDQNDNAPKFTQERYVAAVWEGSSRGTYVAQVSAMDPDQNSNGEIHYSIIMGNDDNAFTLQSKFSGIVKTNIVLDREIRKSYKLEIEAVDMGSPQLSSTCTVRITVIDVNDNSPFFPLPAAVNVHEGKQCTHLPCKAPGDQVQRKKLL
jgi:protocadherin-16/23